MNRTLLVTGGAGFIGSNFIRRWLDDHPGDRVVNLDALTYAGNRATLRDLETRDDYRFVHGDVRDAALLGQLFEEERFDTVVHFAAESHVDRSILGPSAFVETNVRGTFVLLEAARAAWSPAPENARFLHVSTDEVYGTLSPEDPPWTEASPYEPSSPYSATKAASDHLAKAWHRTYGMPIVVSNCSNNYGPYHFPEKLIPLTILNALEGRKLPVYGKGENIRDWLYVDDHARALDIIVEKGEPGETYNVGGRNERKNIDVVLRICAVLDALVPTDKPRAELIEYVTDRPGHDARYAIDATRLENELGWRAQENFDSGIEKTVRWYLDNEWWWQPLREQYDGQRLGLDKAAKVPA